MSPLVTVFGVVIFFECLLLSAFSLSVISAEGQLLIDTVEKLFYWQSKKFLSVSNKVLYFRYVEASEITYLSVEMNTKLYEHYLNQTFEK